MNQQYKKVFIFILFIIAVLSCLYNLPEDDGLRHVGLAFGNLTSWGDVYPFSIFEEFRGYDPWFGYDLTLKIIADILKFLPLSTLTLSFLLIKTITLLFSIVFLYLVIGRSGLVDEIKDRDTFTLAFIILFTLLVFSFLRITIARPFAFGTFFLLYSTGRKGIARGALSSLILTFFYPYLSWFYIVPVSFVHFIKGDKKFAMGAISFMILFLLMQPSSFWGFQIELVKSDIVRNGINVKIREFFFTFKQLPPYLYLTGFLILYLGFSKKARKLNYTNILLLIYLVPAFKYSRYLYDLVLPLLFVSFGKEILQVLTEPYRKSISSWKTIILYNFDKIKKFRKQKPAQSGPMKAGNNEKSETNLKPYIAIAYLPFFALLIVNNFNQLASFKSFQDVLTPVPQNSLILTSFNQQYKILFVRPDLRIIPSCEMGFASQYVSKEYANFFNKGTLLPLCRKTGVKFFLENRDIYINPEQGQFLKPVKKNSSLTLWAFLDLEDAQ